MIRNTAWLFLALAASASAAAAADTVPLDKLTTDQVRARLKEAFEGPGTKQAIARVLEAPGVPFSVAPEGVEYSYAAGKAKLVWRYRSPAPLDPVQQTKVKDALQKVLVESLVQVKVNGTGLVADADGGILARAIELVPYAAAPNTPPTISTVADDTVMSGDTARVSFTVGDKETPFAALRLTARSSDTGLVPASGLVLAGDGPVRDLAITPVPGRTGSVTITVRVTDDGGLSAVSAFRLRVVAAPGKDDRQPKGGGGGGGSGGDGQPSWRPYVWYSPCGTPVVVWYVVTPAPSASAALGRQSPAADAVVTREDLLKGKKAADWERLFNAGHRAFWAGRNAEAVEYFAAAAELQDDPRAWYYMALAQIRAGDAEEAGAAARYAAARSRAEPLLANDVLELMSEVQGPLRARLRELTAGVSPGLTDRAVLAARPRLLRDPATATTTGVAATRTR
jgi:hypothetical protein